MNREVYVSDGDFSLIKMVNEDKEKYVSLIKEISDDKSFYDNPDSADILWKFVMNSDKICCFIYDADGVCCGDVSVRHLNDATPEIGVELVHVMRNKGIAARCIKMLVRKVYEERDDIEYFILRVSSENSHSRHMIEKMGAVHIGEEETIIKKTLREIKERIDRGIIDKEQYKELLDKFSEEEEDRKAIHVYKLMPEVFL